MNQQPPDRRLLGMWIYSKKIIEGKAYIL
jgi:hypothetical protein